jgi:hypothetical protein
MPGPDGTLTSTEQEQFRRWLNDRQRNHNCEVCGFNDWGIGEHLLHGQVFTGGGLVIGGATYPQAFIVCRNCAHVRLFMAVPIGIGTIANPPATAARRQRSARDCAKKRAERAAPHHTGDQAPWMTNPKSKALLPLHLWWRNQSSRARPVLVVHLSQPIFHFDRRI